MNILQILPELNVGGVETGTVDLAKYLVTQGHKSVVVSHGGSLVEALESQGCKHYTLPVHQKNLFTILCCIGKLISIGFTVRHIDFSTASMRRIQLHCGGNIEGTNVPKGIMVEATYLV